VFLDLTGLPPEVKEVDEFLADASPGAYETARRPAPRVASLRRALGPALARPRPLRRHNGFNFDSRRTMWKYRDWVIDALNRDLPFNQFTIEQIAGDLLPGADDRAEDRHRLPPQHR
jgi:hypothetical protein